ncbi:MAG: hypothetical protein FWE29_02570 [Defluviitaleaceae bacterium]|nr:hypothetical protein [Defluviitaleaceae bacterium]
MISNLNLNQPLFATNLIKNKNKNVSSGNNFDSFDTNIAILNGDALVSASIRLPGDGRISASVFRSESFSVDNPTMLVKGINACGTPFEVEVNINEINPQDASFVEMFALDGYFESKGLNLGSTRNAVIGMISQEMSGESFGLVDAFTNLNFISPLKKMLNTQRSHGDWESYLRLNYIIDTLLQFGQ